MYKKLIIILLLIYYYYGGFAQSIADRSALEASVRFLASDGMKGRKVGSKEDLEAAFYIASVLKKHGASFFGGTPFQYFSYALMHDSVVSVVSSLNVWAYVEGNDPLLKGEYIVVGAHFDHLGYRVNYSQQYDTVVYNGANDNASGTAALLDLARMTVQNRGQLKRSVVFIAFSGEEDGLFGSWYAVKKPLISLHSIKFMMNLDMVGMLNHRKKLIVQGTGSFKGGAALMAGLAKQAPFNVKNKRAGLFWDASSDHGPFYRSGIPALMITTDLHPYYHHPEDDSKCIDFDGLREVTMYAYSILNKIANQEMITFSQTKDVIKLKMNNPFLN